MVNASPATDSAMVRHSTPSAAMAVDGGGDRWHLAQNPIDLLVADGLRLVQAEAVDGWIGVRVHGRQARNGAAGATPITPPGRPGTVTTAPSRPRCRPRRALRGGRVRDEHAHRMGVVAEGGHLRLDFRRDVGVAPDLVLPQVCLGLGACRCATGRPALEARVRRSACSDRAAGAGSAGLPGWDARR